MARRLEQAERKESPVRGGAEAGEAFTLDDVKALVKVLEGSDVTSLRWTRDGHKIVICRGAAAVTHVVQHAPAAQPLHAVPPAPSPAAAPAPAAAAPPVAEVIPGTLVTSPFVGTFYRAPSPESPPFVDVGTVVKKGQVLCIVEAMKLMNEIEAELPGRIAEVLVANATPVEFGQPLFRIEPA